MNADDLPEEPHFRSELSVLSPASPKPIHFPAPTDIPVLNNMMDVEYNQTEIHMQDPAMRNTEVRDGAWKDPDAELEAAQGHPAHAEDFETETETAGVTNGVAHLTAYDSAALTTHALQATLEQPEGVSIEDPSAQPDTSPETAIAQTDLQSASEHQRVLDHGLEATSVPPPSEVATDADAFLSQIQNVAMLQVPNAQPMSSNDAATTPADDQAMQPFTPTTSDSIAQPLSTDVPQPGPAQSALNIAAPALSLASLFPSGTLPADLAASLMQGAALPYTPVASAPPVPSASATPLESRREQKIAAGEPLTSDEEKWTADIQQKYDDFIQDERRYVNEGRWDSFPQGSRLFVGNLSSESVTKRDIFHVFHSYGKLAQISIKQAFGFVQFLNASDCTRALDGEQGRSIKDKKIHLEISKPQKSRNQQSNNARRSRSPDPRGADRYSGTGRNDRRGFRSPSPRGAYRDRYDDRHRNRSRSPRGGKGRYGRSPSPRRRDGDDDLPLPKRAPADIPEVQVIVLDNLDREFIGWVEQAFASRSIRVAVLILSPRLDEQAVVRRQILEGVLAVTKLTRQAQNTGKIDLQIFDRRGGQSNVGFEEYSNLDPPTCAELVLRARTTHAAPPPVQYGYSAPSGYGAPSAPPTQYGYAAPPIPPQYSAPPQYAPPPPNAPQYAFPPAPQYAGLKPVPQGSAPPQMPPGAYPGYGPPPSSVPSMGYGPAPGSMPPMMPPQQTMPGAPNGGPTGPPGSAPVDMQQLLARLGNYNK